MEKVIALGNNTGKHVSETQLLSLPICTRVMAQKVIPTLKVLPYDSKRYVYGYAYTRGQRLEFYKIPKAFMTE